MKPYIKQRLFFVRPAATPRPTVISGPAEFLGLEFLNTVSCFETVRVYSRKVFRCAEHAARLKESCEGLGRPFPFSDRDLQQWLSALPQDSGMPDAVIRLSLHWPANESENGRLVAMVRPFTGHPEEWYRDGVEFISSVLRRPSPRAFDPQLKVSQYVSGVLATLDKGERVAHEILFFGDSGVVAEGSVSNLFLFRRGLVLTPSASSGILKGVTRSVVMELAHARGYPVRETRLTRHELYAADECWMTNTSSEILPVVRVDGRTIGSGRPGPVARQLANDFKEEVKRSIV